VLYPRCFPRLLHIPRRPRLKIKIRGGRGRLKKDLCSRQAARGRRQELGCSVWHWQCTPARRPRHKVKRKWLHSGRPHGSDGLRPESRPPPSQTPIPSPTESPGRRASPHSHHRTHRAGFRPGAPVSFRRFRAGWTAVPGRDPRATWTANFGAIWLCRCDLLAGAWQAVPVPERRLAVSLSNVHPPARRHGPRPTNLKA
jgi:hypothetical protein